MTFLQQLQKLRMTANVRVINIAGKVMEAKGFLKVMEEVSGRVI